MILMDTWYMYMWVLILTLLQSIAIFSGCSDCMSAWSTLLLYVANAYTYNLIWVSMYIYSCESNIVSARGGGTSSDV